MNVGYYVGCSGDSLICLFIVVFALLFDLLFLVFLFSFPSATQSVRKDAPHRISPSSQFVGLMHSLNL